MRKETQILHCDSIQNPPQYVKFTSGEVTPPLHFIVESSFHICYFCVYVRPLSSLSAKLAQIFRILSFFKGCALTNGNFTYCGEFHALWGIWYTVAHVTFLTLRLQLLDITPFITFDHFWNFSMSADIVSRLYGGGMGMHDLYSFPRTTQYP